MWVGINPSLIIDKKEVKRIEHIYILINLFPTTHWYLALTPES